MVDKTFKIYGYSVGDSSVGIGSIEFCIDTGIDLSNFDEEDIKNFKENHLTKNKILTGFKKNLNKCFLNQKKISYIDLLYFLSDEIIRELHDNGDLRINDNLINKNNDF